MIYLTEKDILEAATSEDMLDAIEASLRLYEKKEFHMPQRLHVDHEDNVLLLMPCFTKDYFGTKVVTLFPENPAKNVPVLNGIMVLNDAQTGVPVALLDGPALTAVRTAAVGAVSIRHLAREDAHAVGIIGAGVQGFYQARAACSARNITDIFIYDLYPEKSSALKDKLSKALPDVRVHQAARVEDLLEETHIVITATTSLEPVLPDKEELLAGKHFVGIGSYKPEVREFPKALFGLLKTVYIDTEHALEESGDIIVPLRNGWLAQDQIMTLGRFLTEGKSQDQVKQETTFFKSVGMALFDVCASKLIYENSVRKGLGQKIVR
ncbi:MAG: ornithine cyclodeaminase [Planctomycetes bacterium B3_Pla]|nr:MAG: ornithine cyclodeaminase [Planctomycetes bacterium B3_Pla]